ncbi:MAG: hypothetical protein A3C93_00815 [Candidatus Lloydbacteria bacterium RIFCSPHIGHO2_02_FULL_54_17]|uniref:Uncharacterized protein n=1 Tax=Candidatus Lloydbacteria bacterium RIFCSPHIGHO2_02_FULL_54_17 TaxID=1798664 RepID=A0A1G2DGT9_9BACT|nr:MAG: hypothetical protein A2762_06255 [Candidatus Lloydbacteria bacterium RIFCSPHIGHO2_01_FULL_54_11]OGZ12181.1 MAG: hypothetical protein A3C93_00815 [Candidatus Lloydbacteria bacterium RIFCSPHIGHO2_02_FULL_54_17]OGZ12972.1 MAG: hypothetical protein A2948_01260 [Candidatus Lloydbacteria bacterium RIFCSPLOWO2_01_FULL_54_18]
MQRDIIILELKVYQNSEKKPAMRNRLEHAFLRGANSRVLEKHGRCAECAVRKVLATMFAIPAHPILCLDAMLQLCRDDPFEFTDWQDSDLISRINMGTYFSSATPKDIYVETQDGVV